MKHSVCLIFPYFGKLPSYFPMWLESVAYNPQIDILFVTDSDFKEELPSNIKIKKISFQEFKKNIEEWLGFDIALDRPYKTCDLRPLYGDIFYEDIKDYTHWGWCDMDIIMGNLKHFITDDLLTTYDKISQFGHLSILKNNQEIRELYRLVDYKKILQTVKICTFEEIRFEPNINSLLTKNGYKVLNSIPYADIRCDYFNFHLSEYKGGNRTTLQEYKKRIFQFEKGHVYDLVSDQNSIVKTEVAYVHFQKRVIVDKTSQKQDILLVPNAFIDRPEKLDASFIDKHAKGDFLYFVNQFTKRIQRAVLNRLRK